MEDVNMYINKIGFAYIFANKKFQLPIRWEGNDFLEYLQNLLEEYKTIVDKYSNNTYIKDNLPKVCDMIIKSVQCYLCGLLDRAISTIDSLMTFYAEHDMIYTYEGNRFDFFNNDNLNLFRITTVDEDKIQPRSRIFHAPYTMRQNISTCRYSIAGYPCLYLGSNLRICNEEIRNKNLKLTIASKFVINNKYAREDIKLTIIDLASKPSDLLYGLSNEEKNVILNYLDGEELLKEINDTKKQKMNMFCGFNNYLDDELSCGKYVLWYPLVVACSFIRANKESPFAVEYVIPQLLMHWMRKKECYKVDYDKPYKINELFGIRYFSCASIKASKMGYNYVFPASGNQLSKEKPFCTYLSNLFLLTKPRFVHEYPSLDKCEEELVKDKNLKKIN